VAKVGLDGDWWIADIQHGRWGVMECAKRIVDVVLKREPTAWGMERGALYNAVLPQIMSESMRRNHLLQQPVPLTHENRIKTERILWALQGRMEHGKISFARASWNTAMEDQMLQFPSRMVHDDIPDAISYIAQLSQGRMMENFDDLESEPYWRPQDEAVGF
jgi:predicted phage terminase large subunit-like protein